jgi:hypothetical protein
MSAPREFYIPENAHELADPKSDAVVYLSRNGRDQLVLMGFCGKRRKPDFRFWYPNAAEVQKKAVSYFNNRRAHLKRKANDRKEDAAKRAKGHGLQIGHILKSSWGYDQTNVDYYEVVALKGKTMVVLREIGLQSVGGECGAMSDKVMPVAGEYIGEPFNKRVAVDGYVKISSCQYARLWDCTPDHRSWYH